ncbi:MAG: hypothetical protein ACE5HE_00230 [Phycisphaerae bacterium]
MRARIKDTTLEVRKLGQWMQQKCPYNPLAANCGLWCPRFHFRESVESGEIKGGELTEKLRYVVAASEIVLTCGLYSIEFILNPYERREAQT